MAGIGIRDIKTDIEDNEPPLVVNNWYDIKITTVNSATNFGVHLRERVKVVDRIQECCRKAGPTAPPLQNMEIGKLCLARFAVDKVWYRAFIREMDLETGLATVY